MSDQRLALRRLAGQLIMIRLFGTELDAGTAAFIRENRIRGACLFRQNMTDARAAGEIHRRPARRDGAAGADRARPGRRRRGALEMGAGAAVGDGARRGRRSGAGARVGAAVARAVRSLGFNWNFAPVLDLNNNPTTR
jgi:beta-N-acetylhexosaminidase